MAENSKGTALITGASSGIGAIYADRLARRGHDLILVARNKARLNELAERLTDETGRAVDEVVAADLGNEDDLGRVEKVLRTDASITTLVNNAGVGATAPLLASDVGKMEEMITLNVGALTRLTYAAVPGFVKRGAGSIINISSIVGIAPERLNGVYGGSKAFVLAFTLSLQKELLTRTSASRPFFPGLRRPSSGASPAGPWSICRARSSCPPRTWWMPHSPASTWASGSPFRRFRTHATGRLTKRRGRSSCRAFPAARRPPGIELGCRPPPETSPPETSPPETSPIELYGDVGGVPSTPKTRRRIMARPCSLVGSAIALPPPHWPERSRFFFPRSRLMPNRPLLRGAAPRLRRLPQTARPKPSRLSTKPSVHSSSVRPMRPLPICGGASPQRSGPNRNW